jgi:hypothetical protein
VKSARDRIRSHFSEKRMLADIWTLYQRAAKG